jgi:hypothetical protein
VDQNGGPGADSYQGGPGSDTFTDFQGKDVMRGGRDGDGCLATADDSPGDTIVGGQGTDGYFADRGDRVVSAEMKLRETCFD